MASQYEASDLAVIIPTRDRWPILERTLEALRSQSVSGFEIVVVVDGEDQQIPGLRDVRAIVQRHAGAGAARNAGAAATTRPLLLFLGDDTIPTRELVARHLDAHATCPEREVAVLGHVEWHPEVARRRINRWLSWSRSQFDYGSFANDAGHDVGWGRFYASNVSLKRELLLEAGEFDEDFLFYLNEDLDLGFRLARRGMRLIYEPSAVAEHLHPYDWASLVRRFERIAPGERLLAQKVASFEPFFRARCEDAMIRPTSRVWPLLVDAIPSEWKRVRRLAEREANRWYYRALAPAFSASWERAAEMCELRDYLDGEYRAACLIHSADEVERELRLAPDEQTFYRTSRAYLYDLTAFAMSGTKDPYSRVLRNLVVPGARVLDYGCGIGSDGLRLMADGYRVAFADFDSPSLRYLRWRLRRRGREAPVYDVEHDEIPPAFDAVYAFDVIEHVPDPWQFLEQVERLAPTILVNFLEPKAGDTALPHALPIEALLRHARRRGLEYHRRWHGRSHLVAYRGKAATTR